MTDNEDESKLLGEEEEYEDDEEDEEGESWLPTCMLPLRVLFYLLFMILLYPILLIAAVLRAWFQRLVRGKVSDILKWGGRMWPGDVPYEDGVYYAGDVVFTKPFSDQQRLTDIWYAMAEEAGIDKDKAVLQFNAEAPNKTFHRNGAKAADHYVMPGTNFLKQNDTLKTVMFLQIWNGKEGDPTVVYYHLPLGSWDGSSCFNFMRELAARYHGEPPNKDFFQGTSLTLKPESKKRLDEQSSFVLFLCRMPFNVFLNLSTLVWQLIKVAKWAGGPGASQEAAMINFDEKDSARLAAGANKLGMKPFAAMAYAGVKAYREVLGENPHAIVQQSSIQTRHYEPKMDRNAVGDWLIGPLQFIGNREYGHAEAQEGYEKLHDDLNNLQTTAVRALEAKAWGIVTGGASLFEILPTYNDNELLTSSLFFNNYGVRDFSDKSGLHSWNWAAPFRLGFNTINVNGKTCTALASSFIGIDKLEQVRDHVLATLTEIMES